MAKFAVVFLAALAFQAASAGVLMNQRYQETGLGDYKYGLQYHGYPTGKFDVLFGELQTVSQDMTTYFQRALPNDRLVLKTLTWQCRELAMYMDTIIEKIEAETYKYEGKISMVLEQFVSEFRDIKMQYQQMCAYTTDIYAASQMKNQFYMCVQRTIVQLEKLVRFVQTDFNQTYGDLYFMIKNIVTDFLYAYRSIYSQVQYYGDYTQQSPMELVYQIKEVTKYLTGYFQGLTRFDSDRMYAVREYVQQVETIFTKIQRIEGSYENLEVNAAFQRIYSKLHRMHGYFTQMIDAEYMENVEVIRKQLIEELQFVCEAFEQFVQHCQNGGAYRTFFYEILGDYLYTMQQFRMRMMHSGYQYYQGESFGKTGLEGVYGSKMGLYQDAGLWGKTGYQGLYRYGGYGYGLFGKYQGFAKYGQDLKQVDMQIQTIIRDLYKTFQTVSFDDVTVRQAFMQMMRVYAQRLEMMVERMNQYVSYNAGSDLYMYQQVCQNLRQYVVALRQLYANEDSHMEMTTQFYMYVQRISAEFEKLMYSMEQSNGTFYYLVKDVLYQYLTCTYDLYMQMQSMTEIAYYGYPSYARQYYGNDYRMMENINNFGRQYGGKSYARQYFGQDYKMMGMNKRDQYYYGGKSGQMYETPRELVNQIQYVATDLSSTFQTGMTFTQKHAQVLSVQARHFAQIIKNVIDRLESYEHLDTVMEQIIYKLREVQMNFQQLAANNVFTNVQQFKTEFDNYIQIAVAQIEKLVMLCQEESRSNFFYVMKDALHFFLYGLRDMCYQIKEMGQQYGQEYYGKGYGYGKMGHEYGYDKYARGLFGLEKYGKGYGYQNQMGSQMQMGFQNQYRYQNQMGYQYMPYGKMLGSQYNQATIRAY